MEFRSQWYDDYIARIKAIEEDRSNNESITIIPAPNETFNIATICPVKENRPQEETREDHPGSQSE